MEKIPVTIPYFTEDEENAAIRALRSGWVAQGPRVAEFEKGVALHENVRYGIATTSCTSALHLAMVVCGVKSQMDVIAPSFTFVATCNTIIEAGGVPILVDVSPQTYTISCDEIEKVINTRYFERKGKLINKESGNELWGIVPVHQFGLCADMVKINELAQRYNLKVIEDAACALGAKIGSVHEGQFGNVSCVSFHPRKSITTGEGGMILTDDEIGASTMQRLRSHGNSISADARHAGKGFLLPEFDEAGYNYRMTDIQAAVGLEQLKKLDYIIETKRKKAEYYNRLIAESIPEFITPIEPEGYFHTYQSYVCMLDLQKLGLKTIEEGKSYRDKLLGKLEDMGIATRQGTHAVHMLGYYKNRFGYKPDDLPNAYACDSLSISLPLYVQITDSIQEHVIKSIKKTMDKMGE